MVARRFDQHIYKPVTGMAHSTCLAKCSRDFAFTKEQTQCLGDATNIKELASCFRKEKKDKNATAAAAAAAGSEAEQIKKLSYEVEKLQSKLKELSSKHQ